jgi:putative acetyltransferase
MLWRIREAVAGDWRGAVEVVRAVFDEYSFTWDEDDYHADLYDLEGHYLSQGIPFFVATDCDDRVVGTAALGLFDRIPGVEGTVAEHQGALRVCGADCSLERLYVHPDARRQGLGLGLYQRVIDEARARGRGPMELWSDKRFTDAHRLYQRLGAVVVGDRICHDPDQSPEWGLLQRVAP